MSKVIHLSDDAHRKAKAYCHEHGLKMSDWVGGLIDAALAAGFPRRPPNDDNVRMFVKKKRLEQLDAAPAMVEVAHENGAATGGGGERADVGAAPPFWQQRAR